MDRARRTTRPAAASCSCTRAWARLRCGGTFPRALCDARPAAAASCSRAPATDARRRAQPASAGRVDFMHRAGATRCCRRCFAALGVDAQPSPWLFGHSDGGSIALLYAARFPDRVAGVIAARAASLRRGRQPSPASRRRATPTSPPTCASGSRATTTIRTRRSGAGTTSGSIRRSALEHRAARSPRSAAPCSRSRAKTTNTARMAQIDAIARRVPQARAARARRIAATRRTATSPQR